MGVDFWEVPESPPDVHAAPTPDAAGLVFTYQGETYEILAYDGADEFVTVRHVGPRRHGATAPGALSHFQRCIVDECWLLS